MIDGHSSCNGKKRVEVLEEVSRALEVFGVVVVK